MLICDPMKKHFLAIFAILIGVSAFCQEINLPDSLPFEDTIVNMNDDVYTMIHGFNLNPTNPIPTIDGKGS